MQKQQGSPCIRCGKLRVVEKTWKEYLGTSLLTYTRTVCVDAACQKIVDEQIALQKEKRAFNEERRKLQKNRREHSQSTKRSLTFR